MDPQDLTKSENDEIVAFEQRQQIIDGLVMDLEKNLSENVQKVLVEGPIIQAQKRMRNIPKNVLTIMVILLIRPIIAWFINYSETKATDLEGFMKSPLDFMIGFIGQNAEVFLTGLNWFSFVITTIILINIILAAMIFIVSTKKPKYAWKGRSERKMRFEYLKDSLIGLVSEKNADILAKTMQQSYDTVESLDENPKERSLAAKHFSDSIGHAMILANMKQDISQYQKSRWEKDHTDAHLAQLSKHQQVIKTQLKDDETSLQKEFESVLENTSRLSSEIASGLADGITAKELISDTSQKLLADGDLNMQMGQN